MIDALSIEIPAIFLTLVAIFISVLYKDAKKNTHEHTKDLPYYYEISVSMDYLANCVLEDGRFQYRKNVEADITYDNLMYNSLRHAGSLYSMYMYEKLGLETKYKDLRLKSSEYFINRYIEKLDDIRYIVKSIPEEEDINIPIAKSGAAGVTLAALSNLLPENKVSLEVLRGLGEFILSMQNDDGDIYAYYNLDTKEIDKKAQAIYYPAEAAVGLLYLYEVDPQEKWLDVAKKTIFYLVETRKKIEFEQLPFDNWLALAVEMLFKGNYVDKSERNTLMVYIEQMAISTLSKQITNPNNSYFGAFNDNIRPGSIGSILEGLASIYFCTDSDSLRAIIFKSLTIGNRFLNMVQVKTGINAGGVPNSANWVKAGVSPNASVIRIDNVQHIITCWLKYQNLLKITGKY